MTSNRGVGDGERFDSIAVFIRNSVTGLLEQKQIIAIQGKTPRDVQFTWDGKWIIAAGQASDTLESYRMADDGTLSLADSGVSVPSPACIA